MSRATRRPSSRRDTVLIAGCLGVSLFLLVLPAAWSEGIARGIRDTALLPMVWLQRRAEEGRSSRARLDQAVAERDSAVMVARSAVGLAAENARLRALLDLQERRIDAFRSAEVLHQGMPTDGRTLLLGIGRQDGAERYAPVIAPEGLLGLVVSVGSASSIAYTWAHPEFRASAVTADGGVLGVVAPAATEASGLGVLEFRGVAYRDTVPDGTVVVTSGLGGVYPRGLPIGRVAGVHREELGWERVYRLTPLANPGAIGHVLLLRAGRTGNGADSGSGGGGEPR